MIAAFLDREVAREIFGPPDGIVAWGPVGPAELSVVPGGFRLTGAWNFASGSHHASWLGAHVVALGPDGEPLRRADGGEILRTLLFPKSRANMIDIWHVVGLRGTGSDRYSASRSLRPRASYRAARPRDRATPVGAPLLLQQQQCVCRGRCLASARCRTRHDHRLHPTRDGEGAARCPSAAMRDPGDPIAAGTSLGTAGLRARPPARRSRRNLGSGRRDRRAEPGAKYDDSPGFDLGHQSGSRRRQHPIPQLRCHGDFRQPPVRAALSRHAYRLATGPRAAGHYESIGRVLFGLAPDTAMFSF